MTAMSHNPTELAKRLLEIDAPEELRPWLVSASVCIERLGQQLELAEFQARANAKTIEAIAGLARVTKVKRGL